MRAEIEGRKEMGRKRESNREGAGGRTKNIGNEGDTYVE